MKDCSSGWAFNPESHATDAGQSGVAWQGRLGRILNAKTEAERARTEAPDEVLTRTIDGVTVVQRRLR